MTGDVRKQLSEALDQAERVALEASRAGDSRTTTGEHWRWECSHCDTPIPFDGVSVMDEVLRCARCDSYGVGLRSVEEYETRSVGALPHLVTHGCEEMRPVDALHIARWDPSTVLRLVAYFREELQEIDGELADDAADETAQGRLNGVAAFWLGTPEVDR